MERGASTDKGDRHRTNSSGMWRLAWRSLRVSRAMAVVLLLAASLAANAALFVGGVLYNVIDEALTRVAGLDTATSRQRRASDDLKRKNRQLVERNRNLHGHLTRVRQENGRLKSRTNRLRRETSAAVKKTVARSAAAAGRAMATAPAKALPYVGTAVVAGALAWEIGDHCETIRDMKKIQQAIASSESRSEASEDEPRVCGMDIPGRDEVWNQARAAPLAAWQRSREFLADLDPVPPEVETWLDGVMENSKGWLEDGRTLVRDGLDGLFRVFEAPEQGR